MASTDPQPRTDDRLIARLARNIGWLLSGQGVTGLFSLIYLAVAARSLGPKPFGIFMVVLTYAQLFANIIQFQSWKGVIRFGALHLSAGDRERLSRLLGFTAVLDWSSALVGAVLAAAGAFVLAPLFGWSPDIQHKAALFAAALLLTTGATATGMLRLFDRFDLLIYCEAFSPTVRLIGAIIAWLSGGGVSAFLLVWALAALAQTSATWIAALLIHRRRLAIGRQSLKGAVRENPGLWRFMWQTSLAGSFDFFWVQAGTLAVGAFAGPALAGGYRLADRIATSIAKPTETITRALYPELARLVASDDRDTLRKLFRRTAGISIGLAAAVILIAATAGRLILRLIAGKHFEFAQPFLLILAISAAINIAGFSLEPFHNAHGRSGRVLRARVVGTVGYLLLLVLLLPRFGALGAAIATAITSAVIVSQLALSARQILRHGSVKASSPLVADPLAEADIAQG